MINDELKYIFDNVKDWLKFAEAKNAALTAFNAAILAKLVSILMSLRDDQEHLECYLFVSVIFMSISLIMALYSFYPRLSSLLLPEKTGEPGNGNLFFFLTIAQYKEKRYFEEMKKHINENDSEDKTSDRLKLDLINQIIVNSEIAVKKYFLFKWALRFTLAGLLLPVILYFTNSFC